LSGKVSPETPFSGPTGASHEAEEKVAKLLVAITGMALALTIATLVVIYHLGLLK
jgi:hypothetical protein